MGTGMSGPTCWKGRDVRIATVNPGEQEKKIHEAIARRAYQIFESHGCSPGHEYEDWKRAESEVERPLECGLITCDDKVSVSTDLGAFEQGSVDVCVEPRRLSICGRCCAPKGSEAAGPAVDRRYYLLDLPVDVEPSHVRARLNGRILEIDLYRAPLLAKAA